MRTFHCSCGNRIFFTNVQCVNCGHELGFCPHCEQLTDLLPLDEGTWKCGQSDCGGVVMKCRNYEVENVCNGCVPADEAVSPPELCSYCELTRVIPDLEVAGNREKWRELEQAKRRVLFTVDLLGLPIGRDDNDVIPKLVFDFKADASQPIYTGHADGVITINIREADHVEREKARVEFHEPQRTLVGHLRHELGHYYWDVLVRDRRIEEFRRLFGDERSPTYEEAKDRYYREGPVTGWNEKFISAYASMHPWEDFAESFGAYLDMISILDTAKHMTGQQLRMTDCERMLTEYREVGILANSLNREMGLIDLVPEIIGPVVGEKIAFIHQLVIDFGMAIPEAPLAPTV